MKKLLIVLAVAGVALVVSLKVRKREEDRWHEATTS